MKLRVLDLFSGIGALETGASIVTITEIVIAGVAAFLLILLYALMAARAWQRDLQKAIEYERAIRHGRGRT